MRISVCNFIRDVAYFQILVRPRQNNTRAIALASDSTILVNSTYLGLNTIHQYYFKRINSYKLYRKCFLCKRQKVKYPNYEFYLAVEYVLNR